MVKKVACEFANWLALHRWEYEFREERTFTLEELFEIFIVENKIAI